MEKFQPESVTSAPHYDTNRVIVRNQGLMKIRTHLRDLTTWLRILYNGDVINLKVASVDNI